LGTWALSPLYDVMPFFNRVKTPAFRMAIRRSGARLASRDNLIAAAREIASLKENAAQTPDR
jgi:hypothetical protein